MQKRMENILDGQSFGARNNDDIPYMPDIKVEVLKKGNLDNIYFEAYIKNSTTLLDFEEAYQKERKNNKAVRKCQSQRRIIFEKRKAKENELKKMQFMYSLRKERFEEKNNFEIKDIKEEMEPDFEISNDEEKTSKSFKEITDSEKLKIKIWQDRLKANKDKEDDDPYRTL